MCVLKYKIQVFLFYKLLVYSVKLFEKKYFNRPALRTFFFLVQECGTAASGDHKFNSFDIKHNLGVTWSDSFLLSRCIPSC